MERKMEKLHRINENYQFFQVSFTGLSCSWIKSFFVNWWSTSISFHKGTVDGRIQHCDSSVEDVFMWHVWTCKKLSSNKWIQSFGIKIEKKYCHFLEIRDLIGLDKLRLLMIIGKATLARTKLHKGWSLWKWHDENKCAGHSYILSLWNHDWRNVKHLPEC